MSDDKRQIDDKDLDQASGGQGTHPFPRDPIRPEPPTHPSSPIVNPIEPNRPSNPAR